jgi:hypothetical protein
MDVIKTMIFCLVVFAAAMTYLSQAVVRPMLQEGADAIAAQLPAGAR